MIHGILFLISKIQNIDIVYIKTLDKVVANNYNIMYTNG